MKPAPPAPEKRVLPIMTQPLLREQDVVLARQRAKELGRLLGFDAQDQVRLATATSEIARNAFQYGGSGKIEFLLESGPPHTFVMRVSDRGPGIKALDDILQGRYASQTGMGMGLAGTRRLMDVMDVNTSAQGTTVVFGKRLHNVNLPPEQLIANAARQLQQNQTGSPYDELLTHNHELMLALESVQARETELAVKQVELARLNQELEETNRGVVALYAELEEKANELRRADSLKSRFLSHMSHEFRTPLNSILALTDLLRHRVDGDLTEEQAKQVKYIRKAAEELFEMVSDLLDLAKVEAGKTELHLAHMRVSDLLGALRAMLRPLAVNPQVNLVFEDASPELELFTDESKVAQILRNLLSNALKFTEKGEVRVSTTVDAGSKRVLIQVSDTGIGIGPNDGERIFQEFAQVDSPIQRRVRGTGLGLPLSRRLAELLGGSLSVKSKLGEGSTFTLELPLPEDAPNRGTPAPMVEDSDTVLLIDDEETARYLVKRLFRGTRHRLIEATGGVEGAERARFEHPRLIVLDLAMPDRHGFEVLDDLAADPATRDIPVVVHSSLALSPEELARLNARCLAVLPKGREGREEAYEAIRQVLGEPELFRAADPRAAEER